jgi:hypothetical protein
MSLTQSKRTFLFLALSCKIVLFYCAIAKDNAALHWQKQTFPTFLCGSVHNFFSASSAVKRKQAIGSRPIRQAVTRANPT